MDDYMDRELVNKRLEESNKALIKMYEQLGKMNLDDAECVKKLEAISKIHKTIVEDAKNETTRIVEAEKIRVSEVRNEMDAVNESEKLELDRSKVEFDKQKFAEEQDLSKQQLELDTKKVAGELEINREKLELDKQIAAENKESHFFEYMIDGFKIIGTVLAAGITAGVGVWKFNKATSYEKEDAFVTTTNRVTVQEGLKEDKKWKLFSV